MKASQPYLFQKLADTKFWMTSNTEEITLYKLYKESYKQVNSAGNKANTIMLLNNMRSQYGRGLQELPFKKIDWENDFYLSVQQIVESSTEDSTILNSFKDRTQVKKTIMLLLYDNYDNKTTPYYREFKQRFPAEVALMDTIKKGQAKSLLPTILQAIEAKLLLESCCKLIADLYPTLPLLTIHDSIICDAAYIELIKQIVKDSLLQSVGTIPGLKVELMNKELVIKNIQQTVDQDWNDLMVDVKKMKDGPDWVGSFNEEPKEIPLLGIPIRRNGLFVLEKRLAYPVFNDYFDDYFSDCEDGT